MFGISSDNFDGPSGDFYRYVHPEDKQRVSDAVADAMQNRTPFVKEFRIVRPDGTTRWIASRGKFEYRRNGEARRMLGVAVDVTERKQAEEALSTVSRRLIEAHEEERTWIARELPDDINQRIALLAVSLEGLKSELPPGANEAKHYLADVKEQTKELAADVQALSHRLHSSKLEYLGLASAAAAFCREFSESKGVQIDFQSDDVPRSLPKEISLCLFRVMQEALQNASKHSGSEHYNVILVRTSEEIRLTVSDFGRGFDPEVAL